MSSHSIRPSSDRKRVIYDLGSNKGDNIPYYLKKSDVVVAVEANPELCKEIRLRFADPIQQGRLYVENSVLTENGAAAEVYFYLHQEHSEYSRFPVPDESVIKEYEKILLPSIAVRELVRKYGEPYYVKIDIEFYDQAILRALFADGIHPPYISAESQTIDVFATLVAQGGYRSYKLVDGETVSRRFKNLPITTAAGTETYSFPFGSAGPFEADLPGPWMTADNFFQLLAQEGLGWKDIHATNQIDPDAGCRPDPARYVHDYLKKKIKPFIPKPMRPLLWKLLFPSSPRHGG